MSTQNNQIAARLALSTGMVFEGRGFGATNQGIVATGEVVFNTAMTGYQESLTDPSYMGQILIQTQPMIGNTGVNPDDIESSKVQVSGFGVHEYTDACSNYRSTSTLDTSLRQGGVLGISGIDTRALTRTLRSQGGVLGILTDRSDLDDIQLVEMAKGVKSMQGQNLAQRAGCQSPYEWTENLGGWGGPWGGETPPESDCTNPDSAKLFSTKPTVLVMDFGLKSNIVRYLVHTGCRVEVIPQSTPASQIYTQVQAGKAHGLFLSNGPGDPDAINDVVAMLKELIASPALMHFPMYGICLGHQLLSLALGAQTYKLPFGHRGANHPVFDIEHARVLITSQNHGFAVDRASLEQAGGVITHLHLNDQSVAGFRYGDRPLAAVQFHPESSPGPHDAAPFFLSFMSAIKTSVFSPNAASSSNNR